MLLCNMSLWVERKVSGRSVRREEKNREREGEEERQRQSRGRERKREKCCLFSDIVSEALSKEIHKVLKDKNYYAIYNYERKKESK